jgi:hypothetical protein
MTHLRVASIAAGVLLLASCERTPTQPATSDLVASIDPLALSFSATNGLPGAPFQAAAGQGSPANAKGPGAPFPDSIALSAAQKTAIQTLTIAFVTTNASDLAALQAIHAQAMAAVKAGDTRAQVQAILQTAAPTLASLHAAADALHAAISAVLTPAQLAWISAHAPVGPPNGWQPPVPPGPTHP